MLNRLSLSLSLAISIAVAISIALDIVSKADQKAQKSKIRVDCSSNFQSTHSNLPFLAKNSQIFEEEYKKQF